MAFMDIFSNKKIEKEKIKITVDHREKNSLVVSELMKLGFSLDFKQLPVADYLVKGIGIERKTLSDFKSSIINKRIMQQLLELKQYPEHFLILEGLESEDPYAGQIHENAFRGFLLSTILDYKVPIIFSLNEKDTAKFISVLSKKQEREYSIRPSKIFVSEKEQLQFILEGFPQVGPSTAKKLLAHFHTIKDMANASEDELKKVMGKKAGLAHKLFNAEF
jgi:ERCC4-type nuclease